MNSIAKSPTAENAAHAVERLVPVLGDLREEEVEDDDRNEAEDEALGAGPADAACSGAAVEALVAGDDADRAAEEDAFDEALVERPQVHAHAGVLPVGLVRDAELLGGNRPPAEDT